MYQGEDGKTALYWAVEKGNIPVTKILLDKQADIELQANVRICLDVF